MPTYTTSLIFDVVKETNFENRHCKIAFFFFCGNFLDCLPEVLIKELTVLILVMLRGSNCFKYRKLQTNSSESLQR